MELITIKCMRIIVNDKKNIRKTNNRNASDLLYVLSYCTFQIYLKKIIPRSEFLFTLQGSIFIPLFGDYINTTML